MTIREVHGGRKAGNTAEEIALLSGMPQTVNGIITDQSRSRVSKGNNIMFLLFESAILSLKEPSYAVEDWQEPLNLFEDVVGFRDQQAVLLQQEYQLPDEGCYSILYADILHTILKVERLAMQPGNEGLRIESDFAGPFFRMDVWKAGNPVTQHFFDRVAEARDSFWKEIRGQRTPAAIVLPKPWPQGLSLHNLPCLKDSHHGARLGYMFYICSRATDIVFVRADAALVPNPTDEETTQAIGPFVAAYRIALKVPVMHGVSQEVRKVNALMAQAHALGSLSLGRMSPEEAQRFWKPVFEEALPLHKLPLKVVKASYPMLPFDERTGQPIGWDPHVNKPADIEARKLPSSVLDSILHPDRALYQKDSGSIEAPTSSVPAVSYPRIFSYSTYHRILEKSCAEREGIIAAIYLYQCYKLGQPGRLLANPCPSKAEIQYPALYLDEGFYPESDDYEVYDTQIFKEIVGRLPLKLIEDMADEAVPKLDSSTPAPRQRPTFLLLKLLALCDRPQLSTNLIINAVLHHPDASSWHQSAPPNTVPPQPSSS